jgi:hypothetical protein
VVGFECAMEGEWKFVGFSKSKRAHQRVVVVDE